MENDAREPGLAERDPRHLQRLVLQARSAWERDKIFWALVAFTVLVKVIVIWAGGTVFYHTDWARHLFADVAGWNDFVSKSRVGLIPYVQIPKEYPVGAGLLYWMFSCFLPNNYTFEQLLLAHAGFTAIADVANAAVFYTITEKLNRYRAWWITLIFILNPTSLILGPVRFESYVIIFVLIGYYFHKTNRPYWAVFFWSLGFCVKWFPVFFIIAQELQAIMARRNKVQWLKSGAILVGVSGALNLPFVIWNYLKFGNVNNWLWTYVFHMRRPLYWDTLLGVGELWLGKLPWERYASYWSGMLIVATLLYRPKMAIEYKAVLSCLAVILFNRNYSTQFHLWFYPFLFFIMCLEEQEQMKRYLVVFVCLELLNISVYPFSFASTINELHGFAPFAARDHGGHATIFFTAAVCLRAVALVALGTLATKGPDQRFGWIGKAGGRQVQPA